MTEEKVISGLAEDKIKESKGTSAAQQLHNQKSQNAEEVTCSIHISFPSMKMAVGKLIVFQSLSN